MLKKSLGAKPYLDARLSFLALPSERERWQTAADEEELELSVWIRRALKAAPQKVGGPRRDDELSTARVEMRVNAAAKAGWEERASELGLTLTKFLRSVLNEAARKKRRPA